MAEIRWIKLTVDMFDNRKIKQLRKLPEGNNIVLIWVMLLTMAGRCNANGMIFLTENIPYTTKMLADELDFEENTVKLALEALARYEMIIVDGDYFTISGWQEHQNIEGMEKIREQNRLRQKKWYEKQKDLPPPNVIPNVIITQSNATDKEEDKEYIYAHSDCADCAFFEKIWKLYPNKKGKNRVSKKALKKINSIGEERMTAAVKAYAKEVEGTDIKFIMHGSTFFNGGYEDYLDIEQPTEKQNTSVIPQLGHDLR